MTIDAHGWGVRALLVQSRSPRTYWSFERSLPYIGKAATMPPLGLATLAAHLPEPWELRLRDLNVAPLDDLDLCWADVVLVSGMLVQAASVREVVLRAQALGKRTVVGGAGPSSAPELFPEADHLFRGEAEGRLDLLIEVLEGRLKPAPRLLSAEEDARPELSLARVPRLDLLDLSRYANHALQYSRGCPFHCEFCDIVELFGRVPRVKAPGQVLAELDALYARGARGALFFVDDNFIGNRREVARLLPEVQAWQERHEFPFQFSHRGEPQSGCSAPELVSAMVAAGFQEVFLGIETPRRPRCRRRASPRTCACRCPRPLRPSPAPGWRSSPASSWDSTARERTSSTASWSWSLASPIPRAMMGLLMALPGTRLWRRLEREGRLRGQSYGDNFERPNFATTMDERALLTGYRRVVAELYAPDRYYARCALAIDQLPLRARAAADAGGAEGTLGTVARIVWGIGLRSPRRLHFWRLVAHALGRGLGALPRALALAVLGESLIPYTCEVVLPRLDRTIAGLAPPGGEARVAISA